MQIADLSEIKKKLWNGGINVRILCQFDSNTTIEYLLFIPRISYFPLSFPQIIIYFQNYTNIDLRKIPIWLEYEDVPIKWNLPVGVLYDYLFLPANTSAACWTLTMKYDFDYPVEYIIPFNDRLPDGQIDYQKALHLVLINQLKQSCFVLNKNAKPIMQLSEDNSKELWKSIISRNFTSFTNLNKKIVKTIDKIPVKIYIPGTPNVIQAPISKSETLEYVLRTNVPELSSIAHPYIQGIDATSLLTQPLEEVWKVFKHLDNFLYITLIIL